MLNMKSSYIDFFPLPAEVLNFLH